MTQGSDSWVCAENTAHEQDVWQNIWLWHWRKSATHAQHNFFFLLTARPENLDMIAPVREGYTVFSEIIRFIIEHQQEEDVGNFLNR